MTTEPLGVTELICESCRVVAATYTVVYLDGATFRVCPGCRVAAAVLDLTHGH